MHDRGFSRTIPIGASYALPTGEYYPNVTDSIATINTAAQSAATATGKAFTVLVVNIADVTGYLARV